MTSSLPTGRSGRIAALGLLLVAALILWLGVAQPLMALYASRAEDLAEHSDMLDHLDSIALEAPRLHAIVASRRQGAPTTGETLDGTTDALAAAALEGLVQQTASACGITVSSIEDVPATPAGPLRRIGLRVHLSGDYPSLVEMLKRLRHGPPAMLVDDLSVSASSGIASKALDTDFTLYAFRAGNGRA
jgi:hypothetical protein